MLLQVQSAASTQQQQQPPPQQQQRRPHSSGEQPEVEREHSAATATAAALSTTVTSLDSVLFDRDSIIVDRLYHPQQHHHQQQQQQHNKSSSTSSTSTSSSGSTNGSSKAVGPVSEGSWDPLLDGLPRNGGRYCHEADDGVVKGLLKRVYRLWSGGRDTSVISGTASPAVSDHVAVAAVTQLLQYHLHGRSAVAVAVCAEAVICTHVGVVFARTAVYWCVGT
jgi:hypothetical protein